MHRVKLVAVVAAIDSIYRENYLHNNLCMVTQLTG